MAEEFDNFSVFKKRIKELDINAISKSNPIITNNLYKALGLSASAPLAHWHAADAFSPYIRKFGYDFIQSEYEKDDELQDLIPNLITLCKINEATGKDDFFAFLEQIGMSDYYDSLECYIPVHSYTQIDYFANKRKNEDEFILKLCILISWCLYNNFPDDEDKGNEFCATISKRVIYRRKIYDIATISNIVSKLLKSSDFEYTITYKSFVPNGYPKDGTFLLPWNYVTFYPDYIKIEHPKSGHLFRHELIGSKTAFNEVSSYFKRKLPPIYVRTKEYQIIGVYIVEMLTDAIDILDSKASAPNMVITPKKRKQYQQMNNDELRREIKQLKSKYLDYLSDIQDDDFKLLYCIERKTHPAVDETIEDSFIFTVKLGRLVVVVHENIDVNRSSIVFYIKPAMYESAIKEIHSFFASNIVNKRQLIARNKVHFKDSGIVAVERIIHADYNSWKRRIDNL